MKASALLIAFLLISCATAEPVSSFTDVPLWAGFSGHSSTFVNSAEPVTITDVDPLTGLKSAVFTNAITTAT